MSVYLDYLQPAPDDFDSRLKVAEMLGDPTEPGAGLKDLSSYRLGYLDTIRLDRAWQQSQEVSSLEPARLALLSSATTDHLAPAIRIAALRRSIDLELHCGPIGQYAQLLLAEDSLLETIAPTTVVLALTADEMLPEVPLDAAEEALERTLEGVVGHLQSLWRAARRRFSANIIQQTFLNVRPALFGGYDLLNPTAPPAIVARLNVLLARAAKSEGVALLDVAAACLQDGLTHWHDNARWLQAKMEISPRAAPAYGELLARIIGAQLGRSRKCLVLDLDNTLWGGVIGDDGLDGIQLGSGSASGEAFVQVQRYARSLRERGVLLAVCSKNELATAESVFRNHPEMLLGLSDFSAFVANWSDKASNLELIASSLNIGLDSLVFVDDNPVEREQVRQALPEVAVPELPTDPARYVSCIANAGYFEAVSFTPEDAQRAKLYQANAQRQTLERSTGSLDDFLKGLEMQAECLEFQRIDSNRIWQLFSKTNQFNTTTSRFSVSELERFIESDDFLTMQVRLRDRFGDNGIVSLMVLEKAGPVSYQIVNWVMSCRVFGRQLEDAILNLLVEQTLGLGVETITARFVPTSKNGVISNLFERLGFSPATDHGADHQESTWSLRLRSYTPRAHQIKVSDGRPHNGK